MRHYWNFGRVTNCTNVFLSYPQPLQKNRRTWYNYGCLEILTCFPLCSWPCYSAIRNHRSSDNAITQPNNQHPRKTTEVQGEQFIQLFSKTSLSPTEMSTTLHRTEYKSVLSSILACVLQHLNDMFVFRLCQRDRGVVCCWVKMNHTLCPGISQRVCGFFTALPHLSLWPTLERVKSVTATKHNMESALYIV